MRRAQTPLLALPGSLSRLLVLSSGSYAPAIIPAPTGRASFHATARSSNTFVVGGLTVAAGAMAARYGLQLYEKSLGPTPPSEEASGSSSSSSSSSASSSSSTSTGSTTDKAEGAAAGGAGASDPSTFQKSWGAEMLAKRFYRGGFEEKMTRREAALILGVRESATPERIRDRHRKMLMLNHPDMGGSTFLSEKVNEAKDFLLGKGNK